MTLTVDAPPSDSTTGGFDVRTSRSDAMRADLRVSGSITADGAAVFAQVVEGHVRAGRRFLRVHLGGVRGLSDEALRVIAQCHEHLLALRGTLVLTGVDDSIEQTLRRADPTSPLLILSITAAERHH